MAGNVKTEDPVLEKIKSLVDPLNFPDNLKEISNLPLYDLRDISIDESTIISKYLKVKTIKDFSKLSYDQVLEKMNPIREKHY